MDKNNVTTEIWHGHTLKEVREALQEFLNDLQAAVGQSASIEIIDNVLSDKTDAALSAHMGKALRTLIDTNCVKLVDGLDDRILQMRMPAVVLASMEGYNEGKGGNYVPRQGDTYYTVINNAPTIRYMAYNGIGYYDQEPDPRLLYCNALTGKIYRWNPASSSERWIEVSTAAGKADLIDNKMLSPSQWPKTVLKNIDRLDVDSDSYKDGDIYFDSDYLWMKKTVNGNNTAVNLGEPQEGTVYCHESTGNLYRWNKSGKKWVQVGGSGGGGSVNVRVENGKLIFDGSGDSSDNPSGQSDGESSSGTDPIIISSDGSCYVVDLASHGITRGKFTQDTQGKYQPSEYKKMYDNAVGFTRAFEYARDNGYTRVVIPKGDYCFTPVFNVGNTPATPNMNPFLIWILNTDSLDIDMNGSTFHLLVSSTERSSYYNVPSSVATYKYKCTLLGIGQSKNITIRNGNFRGDRFTRKFTNSAENSEESCYGISAAMAHFTHNIHLVNLDGSGFSGDFITSNARRNRIYTEPFWDGVYDGNYNSRVKSLPYTFVKGVKNYGHGYKETGSSIVATDEIAFGFSGVHSIDNWCMGNDMPAYVRNEASRREYSIYNHLGTVRMVNCYAPLIQVLTYAEAVTEAVDTAKNVNKSTSSIVKPLRVINSGYGEHFCLKPNEKYIRLQFLYENGLNPGSARGKGPDDTYFSTYEGESTTDDTGDHDDDVITNNDDENPDVIPYVFTNNIDSGGRGPYINIVPKLNENVLIDRCNIHDNGRGGISGGANNIVIRDCVFMKQQFAGTDSSQGGPAVFTSGNTNYHIDFEDGVSNHCTIEGCEFFSGDGNANPGTLLFPVVLRLDFRNNTCFSCTPTIGHCFNANIESNKFHKASLIGTYSNWCHPEAWLSASKNKMRRVINLVDNTYLMCAAPKFVVRYNTCYNVRNCFIDIADVNTVEPCNARALMEGYKMQRTFEGCRINFQTPSCNAYFETLKNCRISNGTNWTCNSIEDCVLENARFYICGADAPQSETVHLYIRNVKGMTLKSHARPIIAQNCNSDDEGIITDQRPDYVVHYENCEIDISELENSIVAHNRINGGFRFYKGARWYGKMTLLFNGCRFTGNTQTALTNTTQLGGFSDFDAKAIYYDASTGIYYLNRDAVTGSSNTYTLSDSIDIDNIDKVGLEYTLEEQTGTSDVTSDGHEIVTYLLTMDNPNSGRFVFEDCLFDLPDCTLIMNQAVPTRNMYFEFDGCTLNPSTLKLGRSTNASGYEASNAAAHIPDGRYGTKANRPWFTRPGSMYFDTTLGKPVYRSTGDLTVAELYAANSGAGVAFVDATGTTSSNS